MKASLQEGILQNIVSAWDPLLKKQQHMKFLEGHKGWVILTWGREVAEKVQLLDPVR